jgi:hypothetical protein
MHDMNQTGGQVAEMEPSVPLGMGDFDADGGPDPLLTGGDEEKKLNTGALLIVVVLIIAVGVLFTMRQLSQVSATSAPSPVEETVTEFIQNIKTVDPTNKRALTVINEDYQWLQVQLENVQRDPFAPMYDPIVVQSTNTTHVPDNDSERQQAERQRYEELVQLGEDRIELKSVLMGRPPLANVNGKVVRVGDRVPIEGSEISFMVVSIEMDEVKLMTEDPIFDLTVEIVAKVDRDH